MTEHTFESLSSLTVAQLREIAADIDHEELQGYTTMHKEKLVPALCHALGVPDHVVHEVVGIRKGRVKRQIRALKEERDKAIEAHDSAETKRIRKQIRKLKRKIRKATV
jgi:hypothetical protein